MIDQGSTCKVLPLINHSSLYKDGALQKLLGDVECIIKAVWMITTGEPYRYRENSSLSTYLFFNLIFLIIGQLSRCTLYSKQPCITSVDGQYQALPFDYLKWTEQIFEFNKKKKKLPKLPKFYAYRLKGVSNIIAIRLLEKKAETSEKQIGEKLSKFRQTRNLWIFERYT